jgi:hypothetical protein
MNSVRPARDVIFDMVQEWIETTERMQSLIDVDRISDDAPAAS